MSTQNENSADKLKHILSICNDGKEGYRVAAAKVDSPDLKALFTTYSIQRAEFEMQLNTCIRECNTDPDNENGGPLGAIHRAWIDMKTALTSNDNKAVLEACSTGEKAALKAYDEALSDETLSPDTRQILMRQQEGIKDCLKNIQTLEHQHAVS